MSWPAGLATWPLTVTGAPPSRPRDLRVPVTPRPRDAAAAGPGRRGDGGAGAAGAWQAGESGREAAARRWRHASRAGR